MCSIMQGLKTQVCREKFSEINCHSLPLLFSLQDIFGNLNDAMLNRASTADTLAAVDIKVL